MIGLGGRLWRVGVRIVSRLRRLLWVRRLLGRAVASWVGLVGHGATFANGAPLNVEPERGVGRGGVSDSGGGEVCGMFWRLSRNQGSGPSDDEGRLGGATKKKLTGRLQEEQHRRERRGCRVGTKAHQACDWVSVRVAQEIGRAHV